MSRPIMRLFLLFVLLFVVLIAWTSRWTVFEAKALRDNAENKRPLFAAEHVKRGSILGDDHTVLARSVKQRNGTYARRYPVGSLFGHPVGYSNLQLQQLSGLERSRNDELSGQTSELDSIVTQLQGKRQAGDNVVTTLDPKAQKVATDALGGQAGSIVALDPRTGAIKVMVSVPGYDPNAIGAPKVFSQLNQDRTRAPLLDRATQGQYPPGSTFKVLTAAAAIDSGRYTPNSTINGDSPKRVSGVDLQNDFNQSFGDITLTQALTQSVNTVFAQVGVRLGRDTMTQYMKRFGFYAKPQLDYPDNQMVSSGERDPRTGRLLLPTSPQVDLGRMAIGQDKLAVTPLQMAEVVAAVANGGKLMKPHLTDRIVDPDGRTVKTIAPSEQSQAIKPATATALNQMMRNVVEEGTGTAVQLPGVSVAGKTGTAQKGSPGSNITQPWFVAFAPADNPQIAIAVTVEKSAGGFGGSVAAPIARQVLLSLLHP
jgi:peptidoglycan glycosyltransferase